MQNSTQLNPESSAGATGSGVRIAYVGLDVHKLSISLAGLCEGKFIFERVFATADLTELRKALKKLKQLFGQVVVCYEASGCGFRLQRHITEWGYVCQIIAPSLIPTRPGDRRKCDKLDARKLAQYFEAGLLTPIHIPTEEQESVRDFVRCRFAIRKDVVRAKHRVIKMLDRKGRLYRGNAWTTKHRDWLASQEFHLEAERLAFHHLMGNLASQESRLEEVDKQILLISQQEPYREQVSTLRGFRGVDTLTAMVFITELGDIRRFGSPRQLMSYLGLVPAIHQSGQSGNTATGITRAGNSFVRHVMVQASWNYLKKPSLGRKMRDRQEGLPAWVIERSWKAQERIHSRLHHLSGTRGRLVAIPAVARELACFLAGAILELSERSQGSAQATAVQGTSRRTRVPGLPGITVPGGRALTQTH
ncbi:MAG: IS110 family transposase [Vulcanimicrobiota bacterium]